MLNSTKVKNKSSIADAAPSGFVTAQADGFVLDGNAYYYAGTNQYYMTYKSNIAVDNVFNDAVNMDLKVIRVWGFIDVGTPNGDGTFTNNADGVGHKDGIYFQYWDEAAGRPAYNTGSDGLQKLDYIINAAGQRNIKLIVALTNNWADFGGMEQYVKWAGLNNKDDFYTNAQIQGWYKDWISFLLNRQNSITGTTYKNDPTIFAWELANEPRCSSDTTGNTIVNWASDISTYIKSIDPNHMVSVGDEGFMDYEYNDAMTKYGTNHWTYTGNEGLDWNRLMTLPNVDFGTVHLYPDHWGTDAAWGTTWIEHHAQEGHQKPWILEEYGFHDKGVRDSVYQDWFNAVEQNNIGGTNFWLLSGKMADGTLYPDYDGFTVYYPSTTATVISNHAQTMNSKSGGTPPVPDTEPPSQVTGLSVTAVSSDQINVAWNKNSEADLSKYKIYRSSTSGFIPSSGNYIGQSYSTTFIDTGLSASTTYYYKVTAIDISGNEGTPSSQVSSTTTEAMIDNFEGYISDGELQSAWVRNTGGNSLTVTLEANIRYEGSYSMQYDYTIGSPSYAGVMKSQNMDWTDSKGIEFWLDSDNSGRDLTIQFLESSGEYWESTMSLPSSTGIIQIAYDNFAHPSWSSTGNNVKDLGSITQLSLYIGQGSGSTGSGTLYFDNIKPSVGEPPIPDTEPPIQVSGLSVTAISSSGINLNWNDNSELDLSYYNIYRSTSNGFTPSPTNLVATSISSYFSDSGLNAETTYFYRISAVDTSSNEGTFSSQGSATTDVQGSDETAPSIPTGLIPLVISSSQIDLNWNDNTEADISHYNVYRSTSSGFNADSSTYVSQTTSSDYSDTSLTASTLYYYKITAVDTTGNESPTSAQVSQTTESDNGPSGNYTPISIPFVYNGNGDLYWVTDTLGQSINSWGIVELTINGVDFTNKFVHADQSSYNQLPDKINGHYYIHFVSNSDWGHFHAN